MGIFLFRSPRHEPNHPLPSSATVVSAPRNACPATQSTSNLCPGLISKIREYFNSRAEIFGLLLLWKFEFNLEAIAECRVDALLETQHYLLKCGRSSFTDRSRSQRSVSVRICRTEMDRTDNRRIRG